MPNMSTMDGDDDTVLDPVAIVVVVEPVNKSDNVGATSTTQQPNTTIQKKSKFSWLHHGTNLKFVETYFIHEANYKDKILIQHLMQVSPWKARHGNVKAVWKKVLDGIFLEKIHGNFIFAGINIMTIHNRYQNVYLVLVTSGRRNGNNVMLRKHQKTKNQRTGTKEQPNS